MPVNFWDDRYAENDTVYGTEPNAYFREFIDTHRAGRILLPLEGEGRNALYAAQKGYTVEAFDFSVVARTKALERAADRELPLRYTVSSVECFEPAASYDYIALIYAHLVPEVRRPFHRRLAAALNPGGILVLEAFTTDQLQYGSGGPKDPAMLYDSALLREDFSALVVLECREALVELHEGPFHQGLASVVRFKATRI